MKLFSIFKYFAPFLFALALSACDSTPNFEGTYGKLVDGKMTPVIKIYKKDGQLMLVNYGKNSSGSPDLSKARALTIYSSEHPYQRGPAGSWPKDQFELVATSGPRDSFYVCPKGVELLLLGSPQLVGSGYYYSAYASMGTEYFGYGGGELTKLD